MIRVLGACLLLVAVVSVPLPSQAGKCEDKEDHCANDAHITKCDQVDSCIANWYWGDKRCSCAKAKPTSTSCSCHD